MIRTIQVLLTRTAPPGMEHLFADDEAAGGVSKTDGCSDLRKIANNNKEEEEEEG
jgi:hypothetical protein